MEIIKTQNNEELVVQLKGWLDTVSAPELENSLVNELDKIKKLILDFHDVEYISSAGLRVLLLFYKKLNASGSKMIIKHPVDEVIEVFDMTGFSSFLTIEE